MCQAVSILRSELPLDLHVAAEVAGREFRRADGGEVEVRFDWRHASPLLPVWLDGSIRLARWGNRERRGRLPPTGWTWRESVESGRWAGVQPELVTVPATYCLTGGVWYRVREGIEAVCVRDAGRPTVFLIVERATRYFRVMTRSEWAPALIGETI